MSRYTLEEEEQLASLKAFWARYGTLILIVLIIAVVSFAANNGWKWWQNRQSTQAVVVFEKLEESLAKKDLVLTQKIQQNLMDEHAGTPYAERGALLAAKALFEAGNMAGAKKQLEWAVKHAKHTEYAATAALLLSGLLLEEGDYKGAKKTIEGKEYIGFEGLIHDRLGDLAVAEKNIVTARKEYELALTTLQAGNPWIQVVERKISALPKTGE